MNYLFTVAGIFFLIAGWLFMYRKKTILNIFSFLRRQILNDAYVLTDNKKIGALMILISLIFLYFSLILR